MNRLMNIIFFILGICFGVIIQYYVNRSTENNIPIQHQLWIDKYCNVRINRGVRLQQEECKKALKERLKSEI